MFKSAQTRTSRSFSAELLFHLGGPQHVLVHGVLLPQVQDLPLLLYELHDVPASPPLQPAEFLLYGSMALLRVSHFSQFCVINNFTEGALYPIV